MYILNTRIFVNYNSIKLGKNPVKALQNVVHILPRLLCTPLLSKGLYLGSIFFSLHVGGTFIVLIPVPMMGMRKKGGQSDPTQPSGISEGTRRAGA